MAGRWRRRGAYALATVVVLAALPFAVFVLDQALHNERVTRNTVLDTVGNVGSLDPATLDRVLDTIEAEVAERTMVFDGGDRSITGTYAELGMGLDREIVREQVLASGRSKGFLDDALAWWQSFDAPRRIGLTFSLDREVAAAWLAAHPEANPYDPIEPTYTGRNGRFVVRDGSDGLQLDVAGAVEALAAVVGSGDPPLSTEAVWEVVPRVIDDAALEQALSAAEQLVADDLQVMVNGQLATIGRGTVTRWIEPGPIEEGLMPRFIEGRTQRSVERLLAGLIDPGTPPVFAVEAGEVVVELGEEPMRCCADGVAEELYETAAQGHLRIARLDPIPIYDDAGAAAAEELGIRELVGSFTTRHSCCQSRVENIHRIADIVRGQLIEPGGRFSINEFVGQRTREKGFVAAGVISQGHFTDDVGGGISQFATTTFNAAFFAGLDVPTYQSHSIYISRYPYGREATLSYPAPDLELVNNTPYGMLLWTSYDATSITVEIYSTPYFEVEQTGQSRFGWGACTRVETYRSRTDPTGDVINDTFFATYRPGEGLDCAGNRTPDPER